MKLHSALLMVLASVLVAGCTFHEKAVRDETMDARDLTGRFYCGDGKGYNVTLTLHEGGTFESEWRGCLGNYGDTRGTWALTNSTLFLASTTEFGLMKGHLRTLEVMSYREKPIFVRSENWEYFRRIGVDRTSCFQKVTDR